MTQIQVSVTDDKNYNFNQFQIVSNLYLNEDVEKTKDQFYNLCKNNNHSFNIFIDNKRSNSTWSHSHCLMIDVDETITIKDAINRLESLKITYIIVPSKNHLKEKNGKISERFHVYLPLEEKITNSEVFKKTLINYITFLDGDKQAKDLARFFGYNHNLKKNDIIVKKGILTKPYVNEIEDDKDIQHENTKKTTNQKRISHIRPKNLKLFLFHISNIYPQLIFSNFNPTNNTLNFYRNTKDKRPGLYMYSNEKTIYDKAKSKYYELQYSLEDFLNLKKIEKEKTHNTIKNELIKIKDDYYNKPHHKITIIKTNEGAGKSRAVNEIIEPGNIFTFETKKRMIEEMGYIEKKGKEARIIYSNADLLYNIIIMNRGETDQAEKEATEIQQEYLSYYNNFQKLSDDEIKKYKKKLKNYFSKEENNFFKKEKLLEQLNKIKIEEDLEDVEEDITIYGVQLYYFLDCMFGEFKISKEEMKMIIEEYKDQLSAIYQNQEIFFTTNAKLRILASYQPALFHNKIVYQDEFSEESYCPVRIIGPDDRDYELKMSIAARYYSEDFLEQNIQITKDEEEKIKKIKKKYGVEEWIYTTCFGGQVKNLIEVRKMDWYLKPKNLRIIILTTEQLPQEALIESDVIDLQQKMLTPKLNMFYIDGLGQSKNDLFAIQGRDRILATKSSLIEYFNIQEKYIIGDGLGHSVTNGFYNHKNARGTNQMKEDIENEKYKQNVGIIVTFPHPSNINKMKGIFFNRIKQLAESEGKSFYKYINSEEVNSYILEQIINDNMSQSLGRVLGFRESNNVENVIVVINSRLKNYINTCYVTPYCFYYTGLYQSKDKQKKYHKEFKYLTLINSLLTLGGKKISFGKNTKKSLKEILSSSYKYISNNVKKIILKILIYKKRLELHKSKQINLFNYKYKYFIFKFLNMKKLYILTNNTKTIKNEFVGVNLLEFIEKKGINRKMMNWYDGYILKMKLKWV